MATTLTRPIRERRPTHRIMTIAVFVAGFIVPAASPATALAAVQADDWRRRIDAGLARVDSLIRADRLDAARTALDEWSATHTDVPGIDRAEAGLLRGRLARSWTEAEQAFIATAIGYPVTPQAPEALLRLGQGLVAAAIPPAEPDAAARAVAYLERLVADYPNSHVRTQAFLWLARALHADGRAAAACRRLDQAPLAAGDSATVSLILYDKRARCG